MASVLAFRDTVLLITLFFRSRFLLLLFVLLYRWAIEETTTAYQGKGQVE